MIEMLYGRATVSVYATLDFLGVLGVLGGKILLFPP